MAFKIHAGIQISLDNSTWYSLTDHNRSEISMSVEMIENSQRMADGTMRKYVIATKENLSTSWTFVPSKSSLTVDGNKSAAWLESFYNANCKLPIYLRLTASKDTAVTTGSIPNDDTFVNAKLISNGSGTGYTDYHVFITGFSKTIKARTQNSDFVDMTIEFTEI